MVIRFTNVIRIFLEVHPIALCTAVPGLDTKENRIRDSKPAGSGSFALAVLDGVNRVRIGIFCQLGHIIDHHMPLIHRDANIA